MSLSIHPLGLADLADAGRLLASAFQRPGDWENDLRLYLRVQPDGFIIARKQAEPVGMVGTVVYPGYAYVGMMAVHPAHQRQGIGLALMEHLLSRLESQHVAVVLLDASPSGQPLYARLGFLPYDETHVYQPARGFLIPKSTVPVQPAAPGELASLTEFDAGIFGTTRLKILQVLLDFFPGRIFCVREDASRVAGWICAQNSRLGPWVAMNSQAATALLQAALSLPFTSPPSVTVPSSNQEAIDLLTSLGFQKVRTNRHMGMGSSLPPSQRSLVYAQASLSLG